MCGTRRAYQDGCDCQPCRAANAAYQGQYRRAYRSGRPPLGAHVPAHEAQSLLALLRSHDFTNASIARRLGHRWPILQYDPGGVTLRTTLRLRWLARQVSV